jgi:hypothetical protein
MSMTMGSCKLSRAGSSITYLYTTELSHNHFNFLQSAEKEHHASHEECEPGLVV